MRIATYLADGTRHAGLVSGEGLTIVPLALTSEQAGAGILSIIEAMTECDALPASIGSDTKMADVALDAPLPKPRRSLWCAGRSCYARAKELSTSVFKDNSANADEWPIVFTKVPEWVVGPHDDVLVPVEVSTQIDYEAELVVIIGKGGKNITRAAAMNHVFGYTVIYNVTARDVQIRHGQWDLGKSFDTFCPMGPWVATADECDGTKTRARCWVNGELRQDGPTENMIFDIPALIEIVSRGITLYPGDVIATGTPAEVGMGMTPPRCLKSGDVVRVEIDGLGAIENKFV